MPGPASDEFDLEYAASIARRAVQQNCELVDRLDFLVT
jgi:hypothetical protein